MRPTGSVGPELPSGPDSVWGLIRAMVKDDRDQPNRLSAPAAAKQSRLVQAFGFVDLASSGPCCAWGQRLLGLPIG